MRNMINGLLMADIVIIILSLLIGDNNCFINSQIAFISSSLVMFASMISYKNMVKSRLDNETIISNDNHNTIEKIEDPYELYDNKTDTKEIIQEERERLKKNIRSIWQITRDSRASLSFYRLGAYGLLILGFFYLNNNHMLDITPYLLSLAIPPIIVIIIVMKQK